MSGLQYVGQVLNSNNIAKSQHKWLWVTLGLPKGLNANGFTYVILCWVEIVTNRDPRDNRFLRLRVLLQDTSILHSLTKRTTRSFPKWSCSASSQHETVVPAAVTCSYTAECRWQSTVTGSQQYPDITWPFSSPFHRVGGRVIRSPGILQKNGCPSPHPCSVTARVSWISGPKAYHLSPILSHFTWPDSNE